MDKNPTSIRSSTPRKLGETRSSANDSTFNTIVGNDLTLEHLTSRKSRGRCKMIDSSVINVPRS